MPLRYFRRKGRTSCPPPKVLIPELYNVYRCFAQLDDPDRPGCKFYNGDHLSIFKKQIGYVQRGLLPDPPGRVMYVLVKTLTTGFEVHRCLRSTSLLEGYHLHLRRIIDMCARHASLRYKMAVINYFNFRYSVKGLVSSGVLPAIGHFYLWLRDLLCDMIHGTSLEGKVEAVKEWPRMDTSVDPTVPRGLVAAEARPVGQQNTVVAGTVRTRHSGEISSMWMERVVGRSLPSTLHRREQLMAALPVLAANTSVSPAQLLAASGVRAGAGAIDAASDRLASNTTARLNLKKASYDTTVAAQSRRVVSDSALRVAQILPMAAGGAARSGPLPSARPGGGDVNVHVPKPAVGAVMGGEGGGLVSAAGASSDGVDPKESKAERVRRKKREAGKRRRDAKREGMSKDQLSTLKARETEARQKRANHNVSKN